VKCECVDFSAGGEFLHAVNEGDYLLECEGKEVPSTGSPLGTPVRFDASLATSPPAYPRPNGIGRNRCIAERGVPIALGVFAGRRICGTASGLT